MALSALILAYALVQSTAPSNAGPVNVAVGQLVHDAKGGALGRIEAVRTGPDGRARQVLVRVGGVRGVGASTKALPVIALRPEKDGYRTVLTRAEVEALPDAPR